MHALLKPSGKALLLGNHAVVRGALEAGVGLAASYPGTPVSEIGDSFAELAKEAGIYFEWSVNEKLAVEVAAAAAMSGVRSMVSFKHFGWNVASDSIYPLAYLAPKAGMVIVFADDPGCWSSGQSEQDSRFFARIAHMPMLEPATPTECKEFTKTAFELSEKFHLPVIIRLTTRVSHATGIVKLEKIEKGKTRGEFKVNKMATMPPVLLARHRQLHDDLAKIREWAEHSNLNSVTPGKGKIGVIASGVAAEYTKDAAEQLKIKLPILKLGVTWPLPRKLIEKFIKRFSTVFVSEEIEPILEKDIDRFARSVNPKLKILGRDIIPPVCELEPGLLVDRLAKLTGKKAPKLRRVDAVPCRQAVLCPGCPHRATFWAVKNAVPGAVYGGDIGCYILGIFKPLETQDFVISMGAAQGICHGVRKVTDQKAVSFIGDSTFFHAGMPGIANAVWNKSDSLVVVLDNRITAMTGHQPNPSLNWTAMGEPTKALEIDKVASALGVDNVKTVNCFNVAETLAAAKEMAEKPGMKVLISKGECRLLYMRRARKEGKKVPVWRIDPKKCTRCGICLGKFGCPAIHYDGPKNWKRGRFYIDPDFCWGCSVCAQVCPAKAIEVSR